MGKKRRSKPEVSVIESAAGRRFKPAIIYICLALIIANLFIYSQTVGFQFVNYDDDLYITGNMYIRSGLTVDSAKWAFTTGYASNWHPLTWISHLADVSLGGLNPARHHSTALILHILNSILLFLLLNQYTGALHRSAAVAFLFAVHPLHVESVAWVAERKDVLSTLFMFLTLIAYRRYTQRQSTGIYLAVVALYILGLLSKPMLVSLPILLLLLDYWPLGRMGQGIWKLVAEKLPMAAIAVASCVVTYIVQQQGGAMTSMEPFPFTVRLANAVVAYGFYIQKMFWPADLAMFYPHPRGFHPAWAVGLSAAVVVGATALSIAYMRKFKYVFTGWMWFLISLVPVIGLVQVGKQAFADRYTYITLIGLFIIIVWGACDILRRLRVQPASVGWYLCAAVIGALGYAAYVQTGYWKDSVTLFTRTLDVTKDNAMIMNNLGSVYFNSGDTAKAVPLFEEALRIDPGYPEAMFNIGIHKLREGDLQSAKSYFERTIEKKPDHVPAINFLGVALERSGDYASALKCFQKAIGINPDYADAVINSARAYELLGRIPDAIAALKRAAILTPENAKVRHSLGLLLVSQELFGDAQREFRAAIAADPAYALAYYNLGVALQRSNDISGAKENYLKALELDAEIGEAHGNLGVILVNEGQLDDGIAHLREAARLRPDNPSIHASLQSAIAMKSRAR